MEARKFLELPPELKVQIIRKCHGIPYVRLRQSCRFLDDFCEENKKRLGNYCYRRNPHLYLIDSLETDPFSSGNTGLSISSPHLAMNYGRKNGDCQFLVPMSRENAPRIRRSLSGFAFTDVVIKSFSPVSDHQKGQEFTEAVSLFLEIAGDLKIKNLALRNTSTEVIQSIGKTWKLEEVIYYGARSPLIVLEDIKEFTAMKTAKYVYYVVSGSLDEKIILSAAANGKYAYLGMDRFPALTACTVGKKIYTSWQRAAYSQRWFGLRFDEEVDYFGREIGEEYGQHLPKEAVYFGSFSRVTRSGNTISCNKGKYDFWLSKVNDRWQIVSIRRIIWSSYTDVYYYLHMTKSKKNMLYNVMEFTMSMTLGTPLDYSTFYEKLEKAETVEEMKNEVSSFADGVDRRYSKPYSGRRAIPAVIHEMVTEYWNGPKWILELTGKQPRRHPIGHLALVLFQEVFCPIYPYCSR